MRPRTGLWTSDAQKNGEKEVIFTKVILFCDLWGIVAGTQLSSWVSDVERLEKPYGCITDDQNVMSIVICISKSKSVPTYWEVHIFAFWRVR